jgi:acyl-CoA thioester hydrolase
MRIPLEPRYNDYDTRGHINNATYLTYFEVARHHAWQALTGLTEDFPFIMLEASVRYLSQAKWNDPLAIEIRVAEVRTKAWVWAYRIVDPRDERLVAEGRTVQVMFDYAAQRPVPIPAAIAARLRDDASPTAC